MVNEEVRPEGSASEPPMESRPLEVLYEDETLIVLNKPAGIVVQRGYDAAEPVLFEQLSAYLEAKGERGYLMQRLDRGTSGAIFFTKKTEVNSAITRQFEKKIIRKEYLALAVGRILAGEIIDAPLARTGAITFGVRAAGKRCVTLVRPLAAGKGATLVAVDLMTGRTHQIRAHLAAIGHPLVGDWLYGERNAGRPMLHATRLSLRHPVGGRALQFHAPLPADFLNQAAALGMVLPEMAAGSVRTR